MSDINQVDNNSEHCDSPSISALEFNPSAINVSEEIENLWRMNRYLRVKMRTNMLTTKRIFGIVPKFLYAYG